MSRDMGLYDSDTGESLKADVVQDIASLDDPIELWYCKASRGPIVQVRYGARHIHYFYQEPEGQKMIREDEILNGVSLADILENAPNANKEPCESISLSEWQDFRSTKFDEMMRDS